MIKQIFSVFDNFVALESPRLNIAIRAGIVLVIIIAQVLLIRLVWHLFKIWGEKLQVTGDNIFKPFKIKRYTILETKQMTGAVLFLLKLLKWIVTALMLIVTIPIIFSLFAATRNIASLLFGYILKPIKAIAIAFLEYIPNIFTIVIIVIIARYILRSLKFFTNQITRGRLVIHGFYADWAQPTFNILRILVYAFTVAMVYPLLPNSDSQAFQGISVLVGVIFSLGSSSAIGNLVAGIVITYMRPFKLGDRIKIGEVTGFVVEKTPMVTRIRTHKNEFISFPNLTLLNAVITNYTLSAQPGEKGLLMHIDITMNYAVPWPKMHETLINAALKTARTEKEPKPFINQTALNDFYCNYELNVFTKEVDALPAIYSALYQNVQDECKAAGIELTAPHYYDIQTHGAQGMQAPCEPQWPQGAAV
jgi:small-conductance mechanosensitive channel